MRPVARQPLDAVGGEGQMRQFLPSRRLDQVRCDAVACGFGDDAPHIRQHGGRIIRRGEGRVRQPHADIGLGVVVEPRHQRLARREPGRKGLRARLPGRRTGYPRRRSQGPSARAFDMQW